MLRKLLLVPAFLAAAAPAFAQATIDPTRAIGLTPDQIVWKKGVNNDTAWPIGDPKHEDFRFCGKPVATSKPYCGEHCSVAYVGSGKSSRSEEPAAS